MMKFSLRINSIIDHLRAIFLKTGRSQKERQQQGHEDFDKSHRTIRKWLKDNHYEDVLAIIDEIMMEWRKQGKLTRRNWWAILAGDQKGRSRKIAGRSIPVLKAAQIRAGRTVTPNALCRNENEKIESQWKSKRW